MSGTDDEVDDPMDRVAAHKRYNMKSLGRLVDSNRLTGVARPAVPESALPHRSNRAASEEPVDDDEAVDDEVGGVPDGRVDDDGQPGAIRPGDVVDSPAVADRDGRRMPGPVARADSVVTVDDDVAEVRSARRVDFEDGVDRTGIGLTVTRSGLTGRLGGRTPESAGSDDESLARRMLDEEIQPGGRISDPREVPGIVLELAKDLPAAVAVSVVRIDEDIELVGSTVDPMFEADAYSQMFGGVFRSLHVLSGAFRDGPFGPVHDVVIEGEKLVLVMRPLGENYFLMVLEDRTDAAADLEVTRRRLSMLAPGLTAILAHRDGEA